MKIVVATEKGGLNDQVSPVFGRCMTYTIVEHEEGEAKNMEVKENPGATAAGGAGITAAQFVADLKPEAVIAGNFGPNAARVIESMHIKMMQTNGNVGDVLEKYVSGQLQPVKGPTVDDHYGMGGRGRGPGPGRRGGGRGRRR